jgi:soluble lytic murein transglycosylase-like protein
MNKRTFIAGGLAILGLILLMSKTTFAKTAATITGKYSSLVQSMADKYGLPRSRVGAMVLQESKGNPGSVGLAGERGLMQMKSGALSDVNRVYGFGFSFDDLFTPEVAIEAGCAYLAWLEGQFDGDLDLATQAYNAGIGNVKKNPKAGLSYLSQVKAKESYFASL